MTRIETMVRSIAIFVLMMLSLGDCFILHGPDAMSMRKKLVSTDRSASRCINLQMQAESRSSQVFDVRSDRRALLAVPFMTLLDTTKPVYAAAPGCVVVLGATGETGQKCVDALVQRGKKVRAVVRSATSSKGKRITIPQDGEDLVEVVIGDVTRRQDLESVIKGAEAVIFAASASSKGGDPEKVDYQGLVDTAEICIQQNVKRLVIVSSGGVSKPDSSIYQLLNLFGKIMFYKFKVNACAAPPRPICLSHKDSEHISCKSQGDQRCANDRARKQQIIPA